MKALLVLIVLATFAGIFFKYSRKKELKKLFIALSTFGVILTLGVVGNMTKQVFPLYLSHIILMTVSWGAFIIYLFRDRYYGWVIFSPVVTISLFLLLEMLAGSGNEGVISQ